MHIIEKLANVQTMPELDSMRMEVLKAMKADGTQETFKKIQQHFIRAKNRLQRIPLSERTW